jgi:general stress protein 26
MQNQERENETMLTAAGEAAKKAAWAYLATTVGDQPKVRVVHPHWEGQSVWVATGRTSAKARQMERNSKVELFYQVQMPDLVHLTVTGRARFIEDAAEKQRLWSLFDYDLGQFFKGVADPDYGLLRIDADRIELTGLMEMTSGKPPRVWRRRTATSSARQRAFVNYAIKFEQAYASGDWSIIAPCFTDDAAYVVSGAEAFAGTYQSRDGILAYFASITAGLDKRFASREVIVLDGLEDRGDHVWMHWETIYRLNGAPDFHMQGESHAYFDGTQMRRLEDWIPPEVAERTAAYMAEHGGKLA